MCRTLSPRHECDIFICTELHTGTTTSFQNVKCDVIGQESSIASFKATVVKLPRHLASSARLREADGKADLAEPFALVDLVSKSFLDDFDFRWISARYCPDVFVVALV